MHIKSCMFRLEMRDLFISNLIALKSPLITVSMIKTATLAELRTMRDEAKIVKYNSLDVMEPIILEYVKTEQVWRNFMDIASDYGFEEIFQDMLLLCRYTSILQSYEVARHYGP